MKWLKLWNLRRKLRKAMKHTVFHPPYRVYVILDEFSKIDNDVWKKYTQGETK